MACIGTFTKTETGYRGILTALALAVELELRAIRKDQDKAPDFRIFAPHGKVGAAWVRTSAERDYLSCKIDDPLLVAPIFASLVLANDEMSYSLIWSR